MNLVEGFGEAVGRSSSDASPIAGGSRPRSAQRIEAERSLRAARDEAYRAEAGMRGERAEFTEQARQQHVERRSRLSQTPREEAAGDASEANDKVLAEAPAAANETPRPIQGGLAARPPAAPDAAPASNPSSAPAPPADASGQLPPATPIAPAAPVAPSAGPTSAPTAGVAPQRVDAAAPAAPQQRASAPAAARHATPTAPAPPTPEPQPEPLLQQIRLQLNPALRQATLTLSPEHLGRIAIRMEVKDGEVTAVVRVERPETLASLQASLPELRALLAEAGLEAGSIDLGLAGEGAGEFEGSGDDRRRAAQRILSTYYGDEAQAREGASSDLLVSGHVDLYA